jgi:sulfatase maturation enzyme AslB (radical SAM superfamily)
LTDYLLDELEKFKNVSFFASIDGYANLNDTIRKNSNWKNIVENLHILSERFGGYKKISVNTVVQMANVNHLYDLGHWLENLKINKWILTECTQPEDLHYSKQKILFDNRLYTLKLIKNNYNNVQFLNKIYNAQN